MLIHGSQLDVWLHAGKHCTLSLKIIKLINIRHINLNFISVLSVFSICMFKYPYFFFSVQESPETENNGLKTIFVQSLMTNSKLDIKIA